MARMINKVIRYIAISVLALLLTGMREAKADVITFDDVAVPVGGSQQISTNRYQSQGVSFYSALNRTPNPSVVSTTDAHTPTNILWAGLVDINQGDSNGMSAFFSFPGTSIPSATNFISFYVIDNGDQQLPWTYQIGVYTPAGTQYFYQKGSTIFSFTSPVNDIYGFFISFLDRNAISGIDTFTFNSPTNPVPEPATIFLISTGLAGVATRVRRRRKARSSE